MVKACGQSTTRLHNEFVNDASPYFVGLDVGWAEQPVPCIHSEKTA